MHYPKYFTPIKNPLYLSIHNSLSLSLSFSRQHNKNQGFILSNRTSAGGNKLATRQGRRQSIFRQSSLLGNLASDAGKFFPPSLHSLPLDEDGKISTSRDRWHASSCREFSEYARNTSTPAFLLLHSTQADLSSPRC